MKQEESVPKMRSIPHLHELLGIKDLEKFLDGDEYELAEKADGLNFSIMTLDSKNTFGKTKKDSPHKDPEYYLGIYKELKVLGFKTMGEFIQALNKANFPLWITKKFREYDSEIAAAVNEIDSSIHQESLHGINIFGELLSSSQTNTLTYSEDAIGRGAFVVFGCVIRNTENVKGIDISTTQLGIKIMKEFVEQFNRIDGFNIYYKHIFSDKLNKNLLAGIAKFLNQNKDILTSRKRDPEILKKKEAAKKKLEELVNGLKKDTLKRMGKTISFLGKSEIEGIVVRNVKTGAITKIVDLDKFTKLNKLNWEGDKKLGELRSNFISGLISEILKSADIFQLKRKQEEKLSDYLISKKSSDKELKFSSLEELIEVLYEDASEEVKFDEANKLLSNLSNIVSEYLSVIKNLKDEYARKQDIEKQMSEQNYNVLINSLDKEYRIAMDLIPKTKDAIKNQQCPLTSVIKYVLGPKTIDMLIKNFVKLK